MNRPESRIKWMEWNILPPAYKLPARISAEVLKRVGALVGTLLFRVSDVLHLVIDYDTLADQGKSETYTVDLTGVLGTFVSFRTIPSDEEWRDVTICKPGSTGNSYAQINLPDGNFFYFNDSTPTGVKIYQLGKVKFPPGTQFGILATANAGDGSRVTSIMYNTRKLMLP